MEVRVSIGRQIIVDSQVDTLNINASTKYISSDTDALVKFLEFLVAFDTILALDHVIDEDNSIRTALPG